MAKLRTRGPKGYMLGIIMFVCLVIGNQLFLFLYEDLAFHSIYVDVTGGKDFGPADVGLEGVKFMRDDRNKKERISQFMIGKRSSKTKSCVMTISALDNFGFVWNLYDSVQQNSPSVDCFVWFVGDFTNAPDQMPINGWKEITEKVSTFENFHMVTMDKIQKVVPEFIPHQVAFKFERVELQSTIKPYAFVYCFEVIKADQVMFLDNDIWVTSSLGEIQYELSRRSVVLTPHCTTPIPEDGKHQKDKNILSSGVFNFGFVGFSNTPQTAAFLEWWGERVNLYGFVRPEVAMFYDQNWGMFIPALFDHEDHIILRDFRYNVAYWNLHETGPGLSMKDKIPMMKNQATGIDEPVVFMHFSGMSLLEENNMNKISKHQNRFTLNDFPRLGEILVTYMKRVTQFKTLDYRKLSYGYEHFSDGSEVENWMREIYAGIIFPYGEKNIQMDEEPPYKVWLSPWLRVDYNARVDPNPFCADQSCLVDKSKITFLDWLLQVHPDMIVDMEGEYYFSYLEHYVWKKRVKLQVIYPDPTGDDYYDFKDWFLHKFSKEKMIDKRLYMKWKQQYEYNRENHSNFHERAEDNGKVVGMNIIGWHAGQWGVAISGAQIVRAAMNQNIPVNAITDAVLPKKKFALPENLDFPLTRSCSHPVNLAVLNADMVIPLMNEYPGIVWDNKYNIGYWAWELDVFPLKWMKLTKKFDEIWTPSSFIKRAIESSPRYNGIPVKVLAIPLEPLKEEDNLEGSNKKIESRALSKLIEDNKHDKPFVFLTSFDFASFVDRKNPKATIKAFVQAFEGRDDNVLLIVKSHSGTIKDIKKMKKITNGDSRVFFLNENLSDSDNKALQKYQDCFVSLHRSEGYGMNILETMGKGIPVITTNYSGNVEFFNPLRKFIGKCQFPVPYKLIKLKKTFGPYKKGNRWADADVNYVVQAMRKVIHQDCKRLHGKEMSDAVHHEFGPENIGGIIKTYITESLPAILEKQEENDKEAEEREALKFDDKFDDLTDDKEEEDEEEGDDVEEGEEEDDDDNDGYLDEIEEKEKNVPVKTEENKANQDIEGEAQKPEPAKAPENEVNKGNEGEALKPEPAKAPENEVNEGSEGEAPKPEPAEASENEVNKGSESDKPEPAPVQAEENKVE